MTCLKNYQINLFNVSLQVPLIDWGLRDYGLEPLVWGGDGDCKHDFSVIHRRRNDKSGGHGNVGYIGAAKAQDEARFGPPTDSCSKCGAWRGSLGLEPTPGLYVQHLVEIFREVRRVLRDDGTVWLNMGDSYSGSGKHQGINLETRRL